MTVRMYLGTAAGGGIGSDTISAVENVTGSKFNDFLYGNSSVNSIVGMNGKDAINALGGNDTVNGGSVIPVSSTRSARVSSDSRPQTA